MYLVIIIYNFLYTYIVKNFQGSLGFTVLFFHVLLFSVLQCLPVMASSEESVSVNTSSKEHINKVVSLRSSFICRRASMLIYLCIMEYGSTPCNRIKSI